MGALLWKAHATSDPLFLWTGRCTVKCWLTTTVFGPHLCLFDWVLHHPNLPTRWQGLAHQTAKTYGVITVTFHECQVPLTL